MVSKTAVKLVQGATRNYLAIWTRLVGVKSGAGCSTSCSGWAAYALRTVSIADWRSSFVIMPM